MWPSSSSVPRPALTSSVAFTVSDGVDNEEGVTESKSHASVSNESGERESDKHCMVIDGKETVIANEAAGHTSGTNALRQEGTWLKDRQKTQEHHDSRATDFYSKVQPSSVGSRQKAQNTTTSCPRQGNVHEKEWTAKGRCQAGHIEKASRRISYPLVKDRGRPAGGCRPEALHRLNAVIDAVTV
jgi:hypothetical protein